MVVGLGLMVAGTYLAATQHNPLESLESQGIPLHPFKTLAVIGAFLFLFPVIKSFFIQPLNDAIQARNSELENTFTEAESLRNEMTQMKGDYEKRLVATEASAREQIQSEIKKAQELRAQLEADARGQAEDYKRKAIEEVDQEKHRVLSDLRLHVVNLSLGATERILGESVDTDRNRKLVQEFVDNAEVPV